MPIPDNARCIYCGSQDKLAVHHIDGQSSRWGYENRNPANLVVLCGQCHTEEHARATKIRTFPTRRGGRSGRVYPRGGRSVYVYRNYHEV